MYQDAVPILVFHIPHSSTVIPTDVRKQFCLSDEELEKEINAMTDWHTYELFQSAKLPDDGIAVFPVSRIVVDPGVRW